MPRTQTRLTRSAWESSAWILAAAGLALSVSATATVADSPQPGAQPIRVVQAPPQRVTLAKLGRRLTIDFKDQKLKDIFEFLAQTTGADMEILWAEETGEEGLDPEMTVSLKVTNLPVLTTIERLLAKVKPTAGDSTWQMADSGEIQIGTKERLNAYKRVEIYDINDLLMELPDYDEVPEIDLQNALQQSNGGGGQSPFRDQGQNQELDRRTLDDRAQEVIDLIVELVEPEQWQDGGGDGGTIRHLRGALIVNAPDYMHRQINGYPYWPKSLTTTGVTEGRRWVSLGVDTGISKIDGFGQQPVTAVVGGNLISSGPGGGR